MHLGSIVYVVLIEMGPNYAARSTASYIDHFLTSEGGMIAGGSFVHSKFFKEYLTDPVRGRMYVLDGPEYALVAAFFLDCFIQPCSQQEFL